MRTKGLIEEIMADPDKRDELIKHTVSFIYYIERLAKRSPKKKGAIESARQHARNITCLAKEERISFNEAQKRYWRIDGDY